MKKLEEIEKLLRMLRGSQFYSDYSLGYDAVRCAACGEEDEDHDPCEYDEVLKIVETWKEEATDD